MSKAVNLLMPAIGKKEFLSKEAKRIIEAQGGKLILTDLSPEATARTNGHYFYTTPRLSDPSFEPTILQLLEKHSINAILPTRQQEFAWWSDFAKRHSDIQMLLSGRRTIDICNHKANSYEFVKTIGLPTTAYVLKNDTNFEAAQKILGTLPWFAKPVDGSGTRGAGKVETQDDYEKLENDAIVQPMLKGDEYTINVYVDKNKKCRVVIPHKRIEVYDGEVSVGVSVDDPYLLKVGRTIAEKLPEAYGPMCFQLFHDKTLGALNEKSTFVNDLNARFGGGYPLAHAAGGHFLEWLITEAQGQPLPPTVGQWKSGVSFKRVLPQAAAK